MRQAELHRPQEHGPEPARALPTAHSARRHARIERSEGQGARACWWGVGSPPHPIRASGNQNHSSTKRPHALPARPNSNLQASDVLMAFKTASKSMKDGGVPPLLERSSSMSYGHAGHLQNPGTSWGGWCWYVLVDRIPLLFPVVLAVAHFIAYADTTDGALWKCAFCAGVAVFAQVGHRPPPQLPPHRRHAFCACLPSRAQLGFYLFLHGVMQVVYYASGNHTTGRRVLSGNTARNVMKGARREAIVGESSEAVRSSPATNSTTPVTAEIPLRSLPRPPHDGCRSILQPFSRRRPTRGLYVISRPSSFTFTFIERLLRSRHTRRDPMQRRRHPLRSSTPAKDLCRPRLRRVTRPSWHRSGSKKRVCAPAHACGASHHPRPRDVRPSVGHPSRPSPWRRTPA